MDEKYKRLGKNSVFVFIGNVGGRCISLFMMPFYTRWLSPADYGASEMMQCYALVLLDIISFCINSAIFIFPKQSEDNDRSGYLMSGLVYSLIPITAIILLLQFVSKNLLPSENVFNKHFGLTMLLAVSWFFQLYLQNFVRAIDKMKVFSLTGIINTGSIALFSTFLIPLHGLTGFVLAFCAANVVASIYSFLGAGVYHYLSANIRWHYYKEMLAYCLPLVFNTLFLFANSYLNRPLLEFYHGLDAVANMAVAYKFSNMVSALIGVFFLSWQISVLENFGRSDYGQFYNKTWNILFMGILCLSIVLIPIYPVFLAIFAAPAYAHVFRYMPAIMISIPLIFYIHFSEANFLASRQSKKIVVCTTVSAIVSVISNMLLVPLFAIWGVIAAQIAANIASVCAYTWLTKGLVKLRNKCKYIFLLLCYALLALGFAFADTIVVSLISAVFLVLIIVLERHALMRFFYSIIK